MQKHVLDSRNFSMAKSASPFIKEALGVINPYAPRGFNESDIEISQKQIEILEDAIRRYERLEDIKKFSSIVLEDIENVTEEDIQRAIELESMVSIEDEKAVLNLIQNEGFLKDLESADFTEVLSSMQDASDICETSQKEEDFEDYFNDFDI